MTARRLARYAEAVRLVDEGRARPQVVEAVGLLRKGLNGPEIARALGIARATAYQRLTDPTDVKNQQRKAKQNGVCEECGGPTSYGGRDGQPGRFCLECAGRAYAYWSRETVIESIQEYEEWYGRPPGAMDWNLTMARKKAHPERLAEIEKRWEEGLWPEANTVQRYFGSWNAGIEAAGFEPVRPGHRIDPERWRAHLPRGYGSKGAGPKVRRDRRRQTRERTSDSPPREPRSASPWVDDEPPPP